MGKDKNNGDIFTEEGLLNKEVILNGMPLSLKMALGPAIDWANNLDANKNKKKDLAEWAPFVRAAFPHVAGLFMLIDWDGVFQSLLSSRFVTDKKAAEKKCDNLIAIGVQARREIDAKENPTTA